MTRGTHPARTITLFPAHKRGSSGRSSADRASVGGGGEADGGDGDGADEQVAEAFSSAAASAHWSALRAVMTTWAPFCTKPDAIMKPMPREPPVTATVLPATPKRFFTAREAMLRYRTKMTAN